MAGVKIDTGTSLTPGELSGDANGNAKVTLPTVLAQSGYSRAAFEVDAGVITGTADIKNAEVDVDFRTRVSQDTMLDEEVFNYLAQNTGKHSLTLTTMASSFTAGQYTTNSASITTTTTGATLATYAVFPNMGTQTLSADCELAFSAQPTTNTFVEFGLGIPGTAIAAPTDGVFFRLNSAGLQGIASSNGTETSTGVFPLVAGSGSPWAYTNNKRYQFIVYTGGVEAVFWVNDGTGVIMLGSIKLPVAQGRMSMAGGMQFFHKHRITGGAAGGVLQSMLGAYSVRLGGGNFTQLMSSVGNRMYGSYQGLSGGTMGSLANYTNSANPVAAVPTNTTAALGVGLGGQFWETDTLAVTTDGIICSFQNPAVGVNGPGRRLVIRGVSLSSHVQTAITGAPYIAQYSLAFGHTTVSLATAEGVISKAPRRVSLPELTQAVTAAQAVSTIVACPGGGFADFGDAPIFVNPGEFVALVKKKVGTAASAGVVAHTVKFVYGWE